MTDRRDADRPIYTCTGIRALEAKALGGPTRPLMQAAGLAAAEFIRRHLPDTAKRVLIVAGPGNNGGDAFEAAMHLRRGFLGIDLVFAGSRDALSPDARAALALWTDAGGSLLDEIPPQGRWDLAVDGLFGIGLTRPLEGRFADLVRRINSLGVPVISLDIPSGINADTGAVMGVAVHATHTMSFIALKPGLLTLDGPDRCGMLEIADLGLDTESIKPAPGWLLDERCIRAALAPRAQNFHKGLAGSVSVIGGAHGMTGAALIAGRAALKLGAGRVYVGLLDSDALAVDTVAPELMFRSASDAIEPATVIAIGPGLGTGAPALALLGQAIASGLPMVLDADALNLIARDASLVHRVASRAAPTLATPHPAEAARLLGTTTTAIQSDRLAAARRIAQSLNAHVVLKGNGSVLAHPDGTFRINPTGNAGMASAGMGYALTGFAAGLLAQGAEPSCALAAAVWLHGAAGDALAQAGDGPLGITATDIIVSARRILNRLMASPHPA